MTDPVVDRLVLPTVANLRDVGGWVTSDGRSVQRDLLFRSAALDRASTADRDRLRDLGIRTIYDLRSVREVASGPDPVIDDVRGIHLDVLADSAVVAAPAGLDKVLTDPAEMARTNERLADGAGARRMIDSYGQFITLASARTAYGTLFRGLADGAVSLFHCAAGKDRTGWAAAAFLTLLGVGRDAVYEEYLLTNELFLPTVQSVFERFAAAGGDPELLRPLLSVREAYLDNAFATLAEQYGTIENYFDDGLGIGTDVQQALRDRFLA